MTAPPKVIIRGHVFDYIEKAPFAASGMSVLGAIEYDADQDAVKCHECGGWFEFLSHTHLVGKHGLTAAEYKQQHGINAKSALCTPSFSRTRQSNSTAASPAQKMERTQRLIEAGREHKRLHGNNRSNRGPQKERGNATDRCQAQTLFRLQVLAAEVGRTPTAKQRRAAKLDDALLARHFGSTGKALLEAGLSLRLPGKRTRQDGRSLPDGFPSKEDLLNTRMPWPKEYFGVREPERKAVAV